MFLRGNLLKKASPSNSPSKTFWAICVAFGETNWHVSKMTESSLQFGQRLLCGAAALECCDLSQLYVGDRDDADVVSALSLSPETSSAHTHGRSKAAINRSTPKTRCVRKAELQQLSPRRNCKLEIGACRQIILKVQEGGLGGTPFKTAPTNVQKSTGRMIEGCPTGAQTRWSSQLQLCSGRRKNKAKALNSNGWRQTWR